MSDITNFDVMRALSPAWAQSYDQATGANARQPYQTALLNQLMPNKAAPSPANVKAPISIPSLSMYQILFAQGWRENG